MKWICTWVLLLTFGGLSAQEFSVGAGGLWSWSSEYEETIETRNNAVQRIYDSAAGDSVYILTLLTLINVDDHIFKAKPGWQIQGNYDWNFSKKLSLQTGVGLRGRSWEYNAKPKRFFIYEDFVGTIPDEEAPEYTESLVCDHVINNPNAFQESEFADLTTIDLFIPLSLQIAFSDNFDVGFGVLFSSLIKSGIASEYTRTDYFMDNGQQVCENSLDDREDTSGEFFKNMRWSTELSFTYWLNKFGIQAMIQTSTSPLLEKLPAGGPASDQVVTTDAFKPRFMGLLIKYNFGRTTEE